VDLRIRWINGDKSCALFCVRVAGILEPQQPAKRTEFPDTGPKREDSVTDISAKLKDTPRPLFTAEKARGSFQCRTMLIQEQTNPE
jgi:hypothetical protein